MSVVIRGGGFIDLIKGHLLIPQPQPQVVTTSTTTTTTTTSYCTLWQNDTGDDWYGTYTLCDGTQPGGVIGAGQQRCMRTENPPVPAPTYGNLTPLGPCSDPTTTTTSTSTTTTTLPGMAFAGTTGTYSSTASACAAKTCGRSYYRPSSLPIFSIGMIVYDNASLTTPFNGAASWVAIDTSMTFCSGTGWYAIQIDTDGTILASVPC